MIKHIPSPKYPETSGAQANESQRNLSRQSADKLVASFNWSAAAEGSSFWSGVYDRLMQISEDGQLQ